MAAVEDYVDGLEDEDLDALVAVVQPAAVAALRGGTESDELKAQVKRVDMLLSDAEPLAEAMTFYKNFDESAELRAASKATDKAFFTGTKAKKPADGKMTLTVTFPKGAKVLELPDGAVIGPRGTVLTMPKAEMGVQTEEFHGGHANQKVHGGDGGGGGSSAPSKTSISAQREARLQAREKRLKAQHKVEKKAERRRKLNTVVNTVLAVTAVAGLLLATGVLTPSDMQRGRAKAEQGVRKGKQNIQRRKNARRIKKMM